MSSVFGVSVNSKISHVFTKTSKDPLHFGPNKEYVTLNIIGLKLKCFNLFKYLLFKAFTVWLILYFKYFNTLQQQISEICTSLLLPKSKYNR